MNQYPGQRPHQQSTHVTGGGTANVNQGGTQNINTTNNTNTHITNKVRYGSRSRTGWVILVMIAVDVGFFLYGQAAYTGESGDSGDLWRAGISLALLGVTGSLIRRWFRAR